jgi:PAS domain S-box-containing protein
MNLRENKSLRWGLRCLIGVGAVIVAALLRAYFLIQFGRGTYLTFYSAVLLAAILGGWPCGVMATVLSVLILARTPDASTPMTADWIGLALFTVAGVVVSVLAHVAREAWKRADDARRKAEEQAGALRATNVALQTEIAERKRVEESLRRSDQFVELALSSANIVLFTQDRDLRFTWVLNPLFGVTVEQMLGRTDADFASAGPAIEQLIAAKRLVLEQGETMSELVEFQAGDRTVQVLFRGRPKRDANNQIVGLYGLGVDVTERREIEARLQEREHRYRIIFENRHATMLVIDPHDGRIVDANPAAADFYGWTVEELRQMKIADLNALPSAEVAEQMHAAESDRQHRFVFRHRLKDGTYRDVEVFSGPIVVDGRSLLLSAVHDITARIEAEERARIAQNEAALLLAEGRVSRLALLSVVEDERRSQAALRQSEENLRRLNLELEQRVRDRTAELEAANKELEAFNYSVSHDLRAPLRAIDGFAKILQEDFGPLLPPEGQRAVDIILREERRMEELVLDLLRLSRLGAQALDPQPVNLEELATLIGQEILQRMPDRKINLQVGPLPPAWVDVGLIRQVLMNLLENACKFTRPRAVAEIKVSGVQSGREVLYAVEDNGVGFDPARMDRLFGVFQRLHSDEEFQGTGIGLALVKRIVQRHGGRVWAESRPGEGAKFHFALPVKVEPLGEVAPLRSSSSPFPDSRPVA